MNRILMSFFHIMCFLTVLQKSSAKRWLPFHLARSAISTTSLAPTLSPTCSPSADGSYRKNSSHLESNVKMKVVDATSATNCSAADAVIKGRVPNNHISKETTARCTPNAATSKSPCHTNAEICRYTLPPVQTTRRFMIGVHKVGKFRMDIHMSPPNGQESCCHPGGGLPMIPDEFDEELPTHDDPIYQKALTGELAEKIVDAIFKKSQEKGNPVIDPVISETQFKTLSRTLENSMLEREGCCYKVKW